MKKYVFTKKVDEVVQMLIVETDGLGTINNFMVTGLICPKGMTYKDIIEAGFDLKMGDSVSSAQILNVAKATGCEVRCYEGDKLIEDESLYEEGYTLTLPINFSFIDGSDAKVTYLYGYNKDDSHPVELPSADFTLPDPCWLSISMQGSVQQSNQFAPVSQEEVDILNEYLSELLQGSTVVKAYAFSYQEQEQENVLNMGGTKGGSSMLGIVMSVLFAEDPEGDAIPVLMVLTHTKGGEVALTSEPIPTPEPGPALALANGNTGE